MTVNMKTKITKIKQSPAEKTFNAVNIALLLLLCVTTLYPFIYILTYSLNEGADSLKGGLYFLPREWTLFNYQYVLSNGMLKNSYLITIGRTVLGTALGLLVTGLAAYGMSFRTLPYRKFLMMVVLIPMLFSGGIIPYYIQLSSLHLINTFWVYVLPSLFSIWNMFVMTRAFMNLPENLRESAIIDGANELMVLFRIIVPVSLPTISVMALFTAVGHWNDWFTGAFYVNSNNMITVQTYLQRLLSAENMGMLSGNNQIVAEAAFRQSQLSRMTVTAVKMAAVMVGTLPILCVYPFMQKYFVKGVLVGSVKG